MVVGQSAAVDGRAYAEKALPAISQPWDPTVLSQRASPEFRASMPPEKMAKMMSFIGTRLGPLKYPALFTNGTWRAYAGTNGFSVFTVHSADCEFEKARAKVMFLLVRRKGLWYIHGFNVNSDALLE
jgi:hypothetical protein